MGKTFNEGGRPDRARRGLGRFVGWDAYEGGLGGLAAIRRRADRVAVAEGLDPGDVEPFGPPPDDPVHWGDYQWETILVALRDEWAAEAQARAARKAAEAYDRAWAPARRGALLAREAAVAQGLRSAGSGPRPYRSYPQARAVGPALAVQAAYAWVQGGWGAPVALPWA